MSQEAFPRTWEDVSTNNEYETKRLRVPGGFIVAVRDLQLDTSNIIFLSSPDNRWDLES